MSSDHGLTPIDGWVDLFEYTHLAKVAQPCDLVNFSGPEVDDDGIDPRVVLPGSIHNGHYRTSEKSVTQAPAR